ncbi:MAG: sensor domain-containing diguanylate cyclase [Candidatus Schekmanbacteria bacterium]|nr:MAG: sensor domain-containing diguanylate cyclase [Candidatus Schekmanbacteria bacterium]
MGNLKLFFTFKIRLIFALSLLALFLIHTPLNKQFAVVIFLEFIGYGFVCKKLFDKQFSRKLKSFPYIAAIVDVVLVSTLVSFATGGIKPLFPLLCAFIGVYAFFAGLRLSLSVAVVSTFIYFALFKFFGAISHDASYYIVRISLFYIVSFFVGMPVNQKDKHRENSEFLTRRLEAEIEKNNKMKEKIKKQAKELVVMHELGRIMNSENNSLKEISDKVAFILARHLGLKSFCIFILNEETSQLEIKSSVGLPKGIERKIVINVGEGITGKVAKTGDPMLINDVSKDERFTYFGGLCRNIRSYLCVPMTIDNKVVGVISATDDKPGYFTVADMNLLMDVASHLSVAMQNIKYVDKLRSMTSMDGLTGLCNHRFFYHRLKQEIASAGRYRDKLSVVMMDIDFFKRVNDTYGHKAGDRILIGVASIIQSACRESDLVARYGGEEFAIILPRTSKERAMAIAERIRERVKKRSFCINNEGTKVSVTLSAGISEFPTDGQTCNALVEKSDEALYCAKHSGRNRVELYISQ